jgi:hypothetical protein
MVCGTLLLLTVPLDFSKPKELTFARWTDERHFDIDRVLATFGNMQGKMIDYGQHITPPCSQKRFSQKSLAPTAKPSVSPDATSASWPEAGRKN